MSLNKKILATAIVGGLFATAAQAQVVNLSATTVTPIRIAAESSFPATLTDANLAGPPVVRNFDLDISARYNFNTNEIRHGRLECSNFRFEGANVTISAAGSTTTTGPVNGLTTNAIYFTLTSGTSNPDRIVAASVISIDVTGGSSVRSAAPVDCTFGIYDTASQASVGGSSGLITQSVSSGRFIEVVQSLAYDRVFQSNTATVGFAPIFNFFTDGTRTARIGAFRFDVVGNLPRLAATTPILPTGGAVTVAGLLGANSTHVVEGDFSNAANADGTFTGDALARVFLDSDGDCSRGTGTVLNASALSANSATFASGSLGVGGAAGGPPAINFAGTLSVGSPALSGAVGVCYTSRTGEIPTSTYAIRLVPQAATSTVNPAAISTSLGEIGRDGTTLVAPLVQMPTGWISRIALTNTSSVPRPYTISAIGETGNTITTNATNLTGTIPARGQIVIDVPSVLTGFTGSSRAHLSVAIAAPRSTINGVYQIVNPANGSISNHVLVATGSN